MPQHPNHAASYTLFETSIGLCGLAWNERGIIGFQLPEDDASRMHGRIARRFPGIVEAPPPPEIQGVIADVAALLQGEARDLCAVALDMEVEQRLESIAVGREILHRVYVSIRMDVDNRSLQENRRICSGNLAHSPSPLWGGIKGGGAGARPS